jgi:FkbM family methyltransferase
MPEAPTAGVLPTASRVALPGMPPFEMRTHAERDDHHVSRSIAQGGQWEPLETDIFRRILPLFDLFLDVGANIGWYSAIASRTMRPGAAIHAFEPDAANFELLSANVARRDDMTIRLERTALADVTGAAALYRSANNYGDHRLYASHDEARLSDTVPVTTLDAHFDGQTLPPFLLKMDTQGSEPRILRGARAVTGQAAGSVLLIEFWPHGMTNADQDVGAFIAQLAGLPQTPYVLVPEVSKLVRTDWNVLESRLRGDLAPSGGAFVDLLLVTQGSAAERAIADLEHKL